LRHRCAQCGASCQGLRVRVHPEEREALLRHAKQLGIDRPIVGAHLRHNWGRCVFWKDGCWLHAELGAHTKPRTCRQFPFILSPDATALDPACFHAHPDPRGDEPLRFFVGHPPPAPTVDLDWEDLELGRSVRARLQSLPLCAVLDGPRLGSLTRHALSGLDRAEPIAPQGSDRALLDERSQTLIRYGLAPPEGLAELVVGGGQLLIGSGKPLPQGFAAWARLLRTGMV